MMTDATKYLNEETANSLTSFQIEIDTINRDINTFKLLNAETKSPTVWKNCPKCGEEVDQFKSEGIHA